MDRSAAILSVEDVSLYFGANAALAGVSFDVHPGEMCIRDSYWPPSDWSRVPHYDFPSS